MYAAGQSSASYTPQAISCSRTATGAADPQLRQHDIGETLTEQTREEAMRLASEPEQSEQPGWTSSRQCTQS